MSHNRLTIEGLTELREALRQLPETLANEAADIVLQFAEAARSDIANGYPVRTTNLHPSARRKGTWFPPGNLKTRVTATTQRSSVAVRALVQARAPHAHLFEFGTNRRSTEKGYNRGRMPEAPESERMIPKAIRWRARMYAALIAMLEREGFEVSQQ